MSILSYLFSKRNVYDYRGRVCNVKDCKEPVCFGATVPAGRFSFKRFTTGYYCERHSHKILY